MAVEITETDRQTSARYIVGNIQSDIVIRVCVNVKVVVGSMH